MCVYCGYKYYTYDAPARTHKQTIPTTLRPNGACPTTATAAAATATHTLVCVCGCGSSSSEQQQQERAQHALLAYAQPTKLIITIPACCQQQQQQQREAEQQASTAALLSLSIHPSLYRSLSIYLIERDRHSLLDRSRSIDRDRDRQRDNQTTRTHALKRDPQQQQHHQQHHTTRNETGSSLGHTAPVWPAPTREIALE